MTPADNSGESDGHADQNFLSFADWVHRQPVDPAGWIMVGQRNKGDAGDFFTMSALMEPKNDVSILDCQEWDVEKPFGEPSFWAAGGDSAPHYDSGDIETQGDVRFYPFAIFRNQNGLVNARFELRQEFLLYHDTYVDLATREYRRLSKDGTEVAVARYVEDNENVMLLCEEHELRDFLAAKECGLIRYHDHRRFSLHPATKIVECGEAVSIRRNNDTVYSVAIRDERLPLSDYRSFSRLLGKDIIRPYDSPASYHTDWFKCDDTKKYGSFIIGRGENGHEIESTCDTQAPGSAPFLTNVLFERKLLQKYAQEPRRFKLSSTYLSCLYMWGVPIDTNPAGFIHAYLGDLARLPYSEQLHWRAHNVVGAGGMSPERFQRDFMVEGVDPQGDVAFDFKRAYSRFQEASIAHWERPLFQPLKGADEQILDGVRVPFTAEQHELDEQTRWLATLLTDSLDATALEALTRERVQDGRRIALFAELLTQVGMTESDRDCFVCALRAVQTLRSTGAAHRKGSNYTKALQTFGFDGQNGQQIVSALLRDLASGFEGATRAIATQTPRTLDVNEGVRSP